MSKLKGKHKLKLQRISETPVNPEDSVKYSDEFRTAYDKAEIKSKLKDRNPQQQMFYMQRALRYIEFKLRKKYELYAEVDWPTNQKQWAMLLKRFGNAIMVAPTVKDENVVVGVIVDGPLG